MLFVLLGLVAFTGGVAACFLNGLATYLIAKRIGQAPLVWAALAVVPPINVISSFIFYLRVVLGVLDDVKMLKTANEFAKEP